MPSQDASIVKYAIYPAIGICRVGNAPDEYYLAPEYPNQPVPPGTQFKDVRGRIKKQVAKFRVYGLDESGTPVKEIVDGDDTSITWDVHLANRKGVNYQFKNAMDLGAFSFSVPKRNAEVPNRRRHQLIIDPGPRTISGRSKEGPQYRFDTGTFVDKQVRLGELRTDESGRLLVLGGNGMSASLDGSRPTTFANNDGWYDDTSDGPVRATVRIGGETYEAEPAIVAVCPPNYGQGLFGVVTMYDVVYDMFCRDPNSGVSPPARVSFAADIEPVFDCMVQTAWVNQGFHFLFGPGSPSDFSHPDVKAKLANPDDAHKPFRREVFSWFRNPDEDHAVPTDLPPFYGDGFSEHPDAGIVGLSVTRTQYELLRRWSEGDFDSPGSVQSYEQFDQIPVAAQPDALNRAHLEDCLGGPFHPGIELTWTLRVPSMWNAPFRLKVLPRGVEPQDDYGTILRPEVAVGPGGMVEASGPGTLTRWLGVPWQTDEASCMSGYQLGSYISTPSFWAARVPNQVLSQRSLDRLNDTSLPSRQRQKHFDYRQKWLRYFPPSYLDRIQAMVNRWDRVGIVKPHTAPNDHEEVGFPEQIWVESEASDNLFPADATYKQLLIAEDAIDPDAGTNAEFAARALESDLQSLTAEEQPRLLDRDEM